MLNDILGGLNALGERIIAPAARRALQMTDQRGIRVPRISVAPRPRYCLPT